MFLFLAFEVSGWSWCLTWDMVSLSVFIIFSFSFFHIAQLNILTSVLLFDKNRTKAFKMNKNREKRVSKTPTTKHTQQTRGSLTA